MAELEAADVEAVLGDPARVATIAPAFEHVSVACVLLGSASGSTAQLGALHGTRLDMLLLRMLDTTIRGVVDEVSGSVDGGILRSAGELVRARCEGSKIPYVLLDADPADHVQWGAAASGAVERVLSGG